MYYFVKFHPSPRCRHHFLLFNFTNSENPKLKYFTHFNININIKTLIFAHILHFVQPQIPSASLLVLLGLNLAPSPATTFVKNCFAL